MFQPLLPKFNELVTEATSNDRTNLASEQSTNEITNIASEQSTNEATTEVKYHENDASTPHHDCVEKTTKTKRSQKPYSKRYNFMNAKKIKSRNIPESKSIPIDYSLKTHSGYLKTSTSSNNTSNSPVTITSVPNASRDLPQGHQVHWSSTHGWFSIDGVQLPYIIRGDQKLVSVSMFDDRLLLRYPAQYPVYLLHKPPIVCLPGLFYEINLLNRLQEPLGSSAGPLIVGDLLAPLEGLIQFYEEIKNFYSAIDEQELLLDRVVSSSWIQLNNAIIPCIKRMLVSDQKCRLLPLSMVSRAANVTESLFGFALSATMEECEVLTRMCSTACRGTTFDFGTQLIPLKDLLCDLNWVTNILMMVNTDEPLHTTPKKLSRATTKEVGRSGEAQVIPQNNKYTSMAARCENTHHNQREVTDQTCGDIVNAPCSSAMPSGTQTGNTTGISEIVQDINRAPKLHNRNISLSRPSIEPRISKIASSRVSKRHLLLQKMRQVIINRSNSRTQEVDLVLDSSSVTEEL